MCIFEYFVDFFLLITVLFRALLSLLVIYYLMRYYSSVGIEAGGNGNNQWEWKWNGKGMEILGSAMGMEMNHWECEDWKRIKKIFPFISSLDMDMRSY